MKTTRYFDFRRQGPDRIFIVDDWILRVVRNPEYRIVQKDGRIKMWGRIDEFEEKYLRVVVLEDNQTVHNAFFDRTFGRKT